MLQVHAHPRQVPTQAYLSSLSSRLTSFFCFRVSSRLRRASASSLTARSRSRLRLSQRVLVEKAQGKVIVRGRGTEAGAANCLALRTPKHLRASVSSSQAQEYM
jgi:hypothetical protein